MTPKTIPEIFIIESLRLCGEGDGSQEGQLLSIMLHLSGKEKTKYSCIRTKRELDEIIDLFEDSNYRFLHLSYHAEKTESRRHSTSCPTPSSARCMGPACTVGGC